MKIKIYAVFLLTITFFNHYSAQDTLKTNHQKKFGLALSGGGAKGFAHIGLLNAIDSLQIKIDYITGTSMGGILGGLYAMGYTGKDLKSTIYEMNWDRILSNKIPYRKVNIEEKDEFDKYIIEFPIVRGIPTLPSSLIEGQYMGEVLNTLTFPTKHINDFSKLQIPVELTSSDIVSGGLIMQKKGSLPLAIRSTLAIPAAFSPVYIDGKLLVDGGLDRNFPVKEVKDMGADFVIGGYTGFRLFTKEEIENPLKMIYQTHAIRSVEDFKVQGKDTDVLVNFVAPLEDITTKDFKKYKKIIKIGEEETKKILPELVKVAEEQRRLGVVYDHKMMQEVKKPTVEIRYFNEDGTAIASQQEIESIKNLMNLETGTYHDAKTMNQSIDYVFGTRLYDKVYYTYTDSESGLIMNVFVKKAKAGRFKLAPHYDNEQSVGIIVNYTYRDLLFTKSRLVATIDIAEKFKARLNLQKFIDRKNRLFVTAETKYTSTNSNDIFFRLIGETAQGNAVIFPDYKYSNFMGGIGINYKINSNSAIGIGAEHNSELLKNSLNDIARSLLDEYDPKLFSHNNQFVYLKYIQNSLSTRYYAKSGNYLHIGMRTYFNNHYNTYDLDKTQPGLDLYLNPDHDFYTMPEALTAIFINENFAWPVSKQLSLKFNGYLGRHFSRNTIPDENIPYIFLNQKFYTGGSEFNDDGMNPEFEGFKQKELPVNSIAKLGFAAQYNPFGKFYLTPSLSYGRISAELSGFDEGNSQNVFGYGINLGYFSVVGPLNFSVSKNNLIDIWRYYFSIGFKF
ncbi:patatin-like phospholipase family protein [Chryseobacterium sp. R2A-55]|uniref:patatin-like phospholipase family protein n=1 Tax=Chryseobacterium sp. R2A-55 TaxID=2744445 RepID=UPI001F228A67|nr:patatin-like phospholipase family protein [Chryseobacterium sp. R2A-55]